MVDRGARLLELFRADARECLAALAAGAIQIERGEASPDLIAGLFRSAHTLKGGARMLGLDGAAGLADRLEQALTPHRGGGGAPPPALGGDLLPMVDELRVEIWPEPAPRAGGSVVSAPSPPPLRPTVRVQPERIDALVGLVAEAQRAAGRLGRLGDESARALAALLLDAEGSALRLRLVPFGPVFEELDRAVRDAAVADGKEARLDASGADVEADAAVVDAAAEIVLQLARNAVAHGIEPPSERSRAAKPPGGAIRLTVGARGGWLELILADDGRGVDEAAVRARGRALGVTDPTVEDLLFHPGLSTRQEVDQLGGRGIGLDIVRARARAAGGDVAVSWLVGQGTTFVVRLPVSVLYERVLVAELAGGLIGVPLDAVDHVEETATDALAVEGRPDELSVLTVPLGRLFERSGLTHRGWIAPDGRVGVVLDRDALTDRKTPAD